ncbi:hypothetical protein E1292_17890 [Nonomuraea deserti]|uniref:Secreted protein n=1 Tax=Nonomuraea deserti TaxID=1848322 RepID=A0A4V2YAU7_9ACTN|nr:hypothetical protein [Nonomuraea deserti]TDD05126.1 hypothetical protein E1292_17890 [Nonomuraea deserti]
MDRKTSAAIIGATTMIAVLGLGAGSSASASGAAASAPKPPKGARAVVHVSPNPTTERGQEVTITGHCGGGKKLKAVLSGFNGKPALENIRIIEDDPRGFKAKATLVRTIGNGVGPVFVDCGGEVGVTLLVTHV